MSPINVPYNCDKHYKDSPGARGVSDNTFYAKMYTDTQLKEWFIEDPKGNPCLCHIFNLPGTDIKLFHLTIACIGDHQNDIIASIDKEGNLLDQMYANIFGLTYNVRNGITPVMQFRIDSKGHVIISRLVPTTNESFTIAAIVSFPAQRVDTVYKVGENGKFEITDTIKFVPKTYTKAELSAPGYNIWSGNEERIE